MPASRIPTLKDVALRAGVHVATASRALSEEQAGLVNDDTRARVRSAAEALGYRTNAVARSLRRGTTGTIGVVVPDLGNAFIVALLRGIEHEARGRDSLPLVTETHDDPETLRATVQRLLHNRVDAIILCAAHRDDEAFVAELERRVPVVLAVRGFGDAAEGEHVEVLQDDRLGTRAAIRHLLDLGHRRIAQLPANPQISSFSERSAGYRAALETARAGGLDVTDVSSDETAHEATVAEGRRLATALLRRPAGERPTAIFAHNDLMAVGALDALRDEGLRCPEDVSVVGYNDAPLIDHIDPPLSTVRLPGFELGRHSARLAYGLLAGERPIRPRLMLAPEFVERRSTQPAR